MDYEEKREIKRQISQLLADIEQSINEISNSWCDGFKGYVRARIDTLLRGYDMKHTIRDVIKEAVKDRIVKVVFDKDIIIEK